MLSLPSSVRVYAALGATDMRKSFDTLAEEVRRVIEEDPLSGALFVFCNRSRNRIKVLYFDRGGYWLIARRLERGTFAWPKEQNRFVEDGRLGIDNNAAARALRGVAVGRKNWLFAGSEDGGKRAAVIYSLIGTCKLLGIEPFAYLRDALERLPSHPAERVAELTPRAWLSARAGR